MKIGAELEFFLFKDSYDEAAAEALPRPRAALRLDRGLPHPPDDPGRVPHPPDPQRHATPPACPVEFSKGEAGRGQHEINLVYADALEMADRHAIYKNGAKEIAALQRPVAHVHGEVRHGRGRLVVPHPLEPVGRSGDEVA